MGAGCEKEDLSLKKSINGTWKVSKLNISGELQSIIAPSDSIIAPSGNAYYTVHYTNISILIPDTTKGHISGNTFRNTIGMQFEIKEDQQISFKNYGGTRLAEDDWGMSFGENLRNTVKFRISNDELFFIDSRNQSIIVFIEN